MSDSQRQRIDAYIRDGEFIADVCSRAFAGIRSGAVGLAHSIKAVIATPARH